MSDVQNILGGNTGLIVRTWKAVGKELRPEYSVDVWAAERIAGVVLHLAMKRRKLSRR